MLWMAEHLHFITGYMSDLLFQNFVEIYDLKSDPYEMKNLFATMDPKQFATLQKQLHFLATCKGPDCNSVPG